MAVSVFVPVLVAVGLFSLRSFFSRFEGGCGREPSGLAVRAVSTKEEERARPHEDERETSPLSTHPQTSPGTTGMTPQTDRNCQADGLVGAKHRQTDR